MYKYLFTALISTLFVGCETESIETSSVEEVTEEQKLEKNANFSIYSSECTQDSNDTLCGYKEPLSDESVPTLPAALPPACSDKVYCL